MAKAKAKKITKKRAQELLPLFQRMAAAQEEFWDAISEVEQAIKCDLDSTNDFIDVLDVDGVMDFMENLDSFKDGDGGFDDDEGGEDEG